MTPADVPTRIAIYCRVSTAEQAKDGVSLDLQEQKARDYCRLHDLTLVEVIRDEGRSAKSLDRPGIRRLRELIDDGAVNGIVIFKLDRLTRSVVDFGELLRELDEAGVALLSVKDQLDTSSASGRMVVNVMLSVSQWERETIAERTAEALQQVKASGKYLGQPPVGYRVQGGQLVPTERYRLVEAAHALRADGCTLQEIADRFTQQGEQTGNGGTRWHPTTVSRLLRAPLQPAYSSSATSTGAV